MDQATLDLITYRLSYVWAAYSVVMIGLFVYLSTIGRRQRKLAQDINLLRQAIEEKRK